jgi:5-methyltetrahydrofolate--homocysteine methyltransferase
MAMAKGLDSVILDPCDEKIMATLFAANTLLGKDDYCKNYLKAKRDGRLECVSS